MVRRGYAERADSELFPSDAPVLPQHRPELQVEKFSAILGSNDGETFTQIASDVEVPNLDNAPGIDPNDGGSRNIDKYHTCSNVKLPNTVKYRYLKFVGKKDCFTGTAKTCQFSEMYLGLDE